MLTNGDITLYHLQEDETYLPRLYRGVSICARTMTVPAHHGVQSDDLCVVRIPTGEAVLVAIGDCVLLEASQQATPDKARCRRVVGFSDNRRGCTPHWRIVCK